MSGWHGGKPEDRPYSQTHTVPRSPLPEPQIVVLVIIPPVGEQHLPEQHQQEDS